MVIVKLIAAGLLLLIVGIGLWGWLASRPLFQETRDPATAATIADPAQALTFARSADALVLVQEHQGDRIVGIDLTDALGSEQTGDLLDLYDALGYEGLAGIEGKRVSVPITELGMPVNYRYPYVAVGTNYAEHADEVLLDDPPFLFPKLARATAWNAPVAYTDRLDYEAELAVVPLADIRRAEDSVPFGLVLCNDFTDRWTLIRQLKFKAPMGTTGFPDGKGKASFLPTGYLFVIPKSLAYLDTLEHQLWLNDALRQRFVAGEMILKVPQIVAKALELAERAHQSDQGPVPLLPEGYLPKGTLILTGTAAGVIFKPANIWLQAAYLKRGDAVRTEGDTLGHLYNRIQ